MDNFTFYQHDRFLKRINQKVQISFGSDLMNMEPGLLLWEQM
jgi:hypothetical protein